MWRWWWRTLVNLRVRLNRGFAPPDGDTILDQGGTWRSIYIRPGATVTVRSPSILNTGGSVWIDGVIQTAPGVDLEIRSGGHVIVRGKLRTAPGAVSAAAGKIRVTAAGQIEVSGEVAAGEGGNAEGVSGEGNPTPLVARDGGPGGDVELRAKVLFLAGVVRAGRGGDGGHAEATLLRDPPREGNLDAAARSGNGGNGGALTTNAARYVLRPGAVLEAGDGGDASWARCWSPLGDADARVGRGGNGGSCFVAGAQATDGPFIPGSGGRAGDEFAPAEASGRTATAGHESGGNAGLRIGTALAGDAKAGGGCALQIEVGGTPASLPATDQPGPRTLR